MKANIIIVEDNIGEELKGMLSENGYTIQLCINSTEFENTYKTFKPDLLLLDIKLQNSKLDGLEIFRMLKDESNFNSEVIVLSGEATRKEIAESMKLGAYTFIEKSGGFDEDKFLIDVENAIKLKKQKDKISQLESDLIDLQIKNKNKDNRINPFIGESIKINRVKKLISRFSEKTNTTNILVVGDTGTGKEIVANNLHYFSEKHKDENFVKINCGAIPKNLIERELFGNEKGAFTGADKLKKGYLETSGKGTLFLDEIETLSKDMQVKLLRVLENNEFYRIGADKLTKLESRIIFGTNIDPDNLLETGKMREDFYYRLDSAIRIDLPKLVERGEDILLLLQYFITSESNYFKIEIDFNSYNLNDIKDDLLSYSWFGNIRELKNFATKLVLASEDDKLTNSKIISLLNKIKKKRGSRSDLFGFEDDSNSNDGENGSSILNIPIYQNAIEQFEAKYFSYRLLKNNQNKTKTAKELQYDRTALYKKLNKYGITK